MEHIAKSTLLYKARRICMLNADVHKFTADLNEHWAKAKATGFNLTRVLKIKTLINQARTEGKTTQAFVANGKITNQDTYSMGKPGPNGHQRCYYCQGENHISHFCPKNPNAYHTPLEQQPNSWVIDSGVTDHITNDNTTLISPSPCTRFVKTAGGMRIKIKARGQVIVNVDGHKVYLNNVLYVPEASVNLMSVQALTNNSVHVIFIPENAHLKWPNSHEVKGYTNIHMRHWEIHPTKAEALISTIDDEMNDLPEQLNTNDPPKPQSFTRDFIHE
ncbi:hypothetical protein NDA14_006391 [Ustilago hordei]|nr:hypothetical protein NDA14_006391 [Ustilago hordei]